MNYYETLGVSRNSEPEVIEAAYRALMKKYHPDLWEGDKAEAEPRAKSINEAYWTLRDQRRRRAYDQLLAPDPRETRRTRPVSAQSPPPARARQPVRRRAPERDPRAKAAPTSRGTANDTRILAGVAISAAVALAVLVLGTRGSIGAQLGGADPFALRPVAASLLSGGRKQTVCIANKTSRRVGYTLYWGGTTGRQYMLDAGHRMVHSSAYRSSPLVEFSGSDSGEPVRKVISGAVTSGSAEACRPSYSFEDEPLDGSSWPAENRLDLYGEERTAMRPQNF